MQDFNDILSGSQLLGGGLMLMAAGWIGYQLRELPGRLFALVRTFTTRVVQIRETHPLYEAWLGLLTDNAIRAGGPRTLEVRAARHRDEGADASLAAGSALFWARVCGKWCRVRVHREDASGSSYDLVRRFMITVEVVFATRADLATMLLEAKARANVGHQQQFVDICNKHGSTTRMIMPRRSPRTLCLPRGYFEALESRLAEFVESREDYERSGIPWRFGLLLYGAPGTGKTSLAHTLASALSRRLAVIPLADLLSDEDLVSAFEAVIDPSIVLIEDVDCAFAQRSNEEARGITFSGFLNCIDGMLAPHNGRIMIMSTNHMERLDPALIRPGRVDLRLEVPLLTREAALDYVDRVFPHVGTRHAVVARVMSEPRPTAASLINGLLSEDWRRPRVPRATAPRIPAAGAAVAQRPPLRSQ